MYSRCCWCTLGVEISRLLPRWDAADNNESTLPNSLCIDVDSGSELITLLSEKSPERRLLFGSRDSSKDMVWCDDGSIDDMISIWDDGFIGFDFVPNK